MVGRKFSSFLGDPDRASGKLILNGGVDSTKLMNVTVTMVGLPSEKFC